MDNELKYKLKEVFDETATVIRSLRQNFENVLARLEEIAAVHLMTENERPAPAKKPRITRTIKSDQEEQENFVVKQENSKGLKNRKSSAIIEKEISEKVKEKITKVESIYKTPLSSKVDDCVSIATPLSNLSRMRKRLLDVTNKIDSNHDGFEVPSRLMSKPLKSRCIVFDDLKVEDETDEDIAFPIRRSERFPIWSLASKRKSLTIRQSFVTPDVVDVFFGSRPIQIRDPRSVFYPCRSSENFDRSSSSLFAE